MTAQAMPASADARRLRPMVTPEGLALMVTVASRGARAGALALDFIIIHGLMLVLTLFLLYLAFGVVGLDWAGAEAGDAPGALELLAALWIIAMFLFRNGYFLFFELGPRGATPGKRLAGIRVAARDGGRLRVQAVIARNLLRDIEMFLPLVLIAGAQDGAGGPAGLAAAAWFATFMLFPFFNRDALRAGDLIAGTWVVEAPKRTLATIMASRETGGPETRGLKAGGLKAGGRKAWRRENPAQPAPPRFSDADLSVYGEYELQTLERILRDSRRETIATVAETIRAKIGWSGEAADDRAFLDAYYAQLRERLERDMRFGRRKANKHAQSE